MNTTHITSPDAFDIAQKLISYPTITPLELGIYEYIQALLPDFQALRIDREGVQNLFLYKIPKHIESQINLPKFTASQDFKNKEFDSHLQANDMGCRIKHLCFAGHVDVVPPGGVWQQDSNNMVLDTTPNRGTDSNLNSKQWQFHPFTPTIQNGYLYGRGAQDMKSGIACFIHAIKWYLANECSFDYILSVLLTSDEEGEAIYGTKYVLEFLRQHDFMPTHCLVAEPTSEHIAGDIIKIGRRGSINGTIYIEGKQGHVAYPSKCINPVELLGERLGKLAGVNLDNGSKEFEPSKLVITDIRGGIEAVNVTPSDIKIMFNVRNSTQTTLKSLRDYVESVLKGLPYTLELKQSAQSFLTVDTRFLELLESSIMESHKEFTFAMSDNTKLYNHEILSSRLENSDKIFVSKKSTSGGTSDARFFSEFGVNVAEIGVCNDRIHAINERVSLNDIERLSKIFFCILRKFHTM